MPHTVVTSGKGNGSCLKRLRSATRAMSSFAEDFLFSNFYEGHHIMKATTHVRFYLQQCIFSNHINRSDSVNKTTHKRVVIIDISVSACYIEPKLLKKTKTFQK